MQTSNQDESESIGRSTEVIRGLSLLLLSFTWLPTCTSALANVESGARLQVAVVNEGGQPLPCRVHLIDQQGKAQKALEQPFWHDHFVCTGRATVSLAPGKYQYAI